MPAVTSRTLFAFPFRLLLLLAQVVCLIQEDCVLRETRRREYDHKETRTLYSEKQEDVNTITKKPGLCTQRNKKT